MGHHSTTWLRHITVAERNALIGRALEMRTQGMQVAAIARELGVAERTVTLWTNPESHTRMLDREAKYRESKRAYNRRYQKQERETLKGFKPHMASPRPPDSDVAARLAEIPVDNRTLTQRLAGDPLPGRSALSQRMQSR